MAPIPPPGDASRPDRPPGVPTWRTHRTPGVVAREILDGVVRWRVALTMGAGVLFRLAGYFSDRGYWMDEVSLVSNIERLAPLEFFGPLRHQQLAAPGFLVAMWASGGWLGDNPYAMRLVPLLGGIASMFLFLAMARRVLPPRAVLPALALFAGSDDLIYFASEAKQYSTDVASALACLLLGLTVGSRPLSRTTAGLLGAWGASIVWFSHPSIFVLAGVGMVGLSRALRSKDWRWAGLWLVVGMAWVGSFAGVHAVSTRQLGEGGRMWRFWDFAFPPMPPGSAWDATWALRRLAYYFVNPLRFDSPFGASLSMLPAVGLALLGCARLWKLDRGRAALLALPVALTLLASSMRLYPFHGRLILFLAPIPLIAIASGLERVREGRGRGVLYFVLVVVVLVIPGFAAFGVFEPARRFHNHLGDLRPNSLDPYRFPF